MLQTDWSLCVCVRARVWKRRKNIWGASAYSAVRWENAWIPSLCLWGRGMPRNVNFLSLLPSPQRPESSQKEVLFIYNASPWNSFASTEREREKKVTPPWCVLIWTMLSVRWTLEHALRLKILIYRAITYSNRSGNRRRMDLLLNPFLEAVEQEE